MKNSLEVQSTKQFVAVFLGWSIDQGFPTTNAQSLVDLDFLGMCNFKSSPPRLPIGSLKELNSARFNSHTPACKPRHKNETCGVFSGEIPNFCKGKTWKKNLHTSFIHHWITMVDVYTSWWLNQPIWKILVKLNYSPSFGMKIKKSLSCHHPVQCHFPNLDLGPSLKKQMSIVGDQSSHTREEVWRCQRKWEIWKRSNRFENVWNRKQKNCPIKTV